MASQDTENNDDDLFKERLKTARELRKMSQGELAEKTRLPPSSVSHFEAGNRKPSFDNLRKLAAALSVTTDYLLGRTETLGPPGEADVLFRDAHKLSDKDRDLALDFIRMLAIRKESK
ncbi:MAG: helix-turn-helix domain-containing protein [Roseiarcus sp.]